MKKLWIIITTAMLIFVQALQVSARSEYEATKEKKVHNQYTVQPMDKLVIDNMYGRVHINTWDKNEITIDIAVTVKAKTESDAQTILDRISFVMPSNEEGGHKIFCKTVLEPLKHDIQHSEMTIDYTINAPKKNAIDVTNKYGDVYLGDFSGKMRMNVSYGALDMQTISGDDKQIKVAFGSIMASSIESGALDVSYSDVTIDKAGDIEVTNKFGKLDIGAVQNLKIDQRYGNVEIGSANQVSGNIDYANIEIGSLLKSIALTVKYCGKIDLKSVGAHVDLLNMEAHYSNLFFHFAEDANLSIDIAASYCTVKKGAFSKSIELVNLDPNSINSESYKGKVGKGEGSMTINAHYSNINFK